MSDALHAVLDDHALAPPETVVGTLLRDRNRGHEVISFAYDPTYLAAPSRIEIDPELPLHAGRLHAPLDRLFGVFRDSSPDETDPTPSVANLRSTRELYRLAEKGALAIETEVRAAVRCWENVATELQIARPERAQLAAIIDPSRA